MSLYNYFVETKEGLTFHFYTSDIKEVEEGLKRKKEFSEGDYWILDAGYNQDIKDAYEVFEEDDVMVAEPETTLQAPVPEDGELAAIVKLPLLH